MTCLTIPEVIEVGGIVLIFCLVVFLPFHYVYRHLHGDRCDAQRRKRKR